MATVDPFNHQSQITAKGDTPSPFFVRQWQNLIQLVQDTAAALAAAIAAQTTADAALPKALTSAHLFVGNASNIATDRALSGDATVNNIGVLTLANSGVSAGTYGDATHVAQITVDVKGRVTVAADVAISGGGGGSTDVNPFSDGGITKPTAAAFSVVDDATAGHGTGSKADLTNRGVEFTNTHGSGGATQSLFYKAAVSSTLVSVIAYVAPNFNELSSNFFYGLAVRDNAGKIHAFGFRNNGDNVIFSDFRYTDIATFSAAANQTGGGQCFGRPCWLKLAKVSTNFVFSVSMNGETYYTVQTVSATAFVGATLNDVGILFVNNMGTGSILTVDCFSFSHL